MRKYALAMSYLAKHLPVNFILQLSISYQIHLQEGNITKTDNGFNTLLFKHVA